MEAAAYFGIPWDEFLRKPMDRRAEMIAHLIIKATRENYLHEKLSAKAKEESGAKGGYYNPELEQKRKWRL